MPVPSAYNSSCNSMPSIDLNCDMGEGIGNDASIMPFITSANIACGFHAGDEDTMKQTIQLALFHNVAIGAHPSFNDKNNFGRTEMHLSPQQLYDLITTQVYLLQTLATKEGARLHHVKPHGALYNMAAADAEMSHTIAKAISDVDASLILYGLSNSHLITEAEKLGLRIASEVFADRTYQDNGKLTPRSQPNALIEDEEASLQQVLQMIEQQTVTTVSGKTIAIKADTICLHGDGKHAAEFAEHIHRSLKQKRIDIKAV
jgi:5-oxoprolinase (ATP-hydrolysing) subunit A